MDKAQEPKYDIRDGQIVNRATGEPIPADEPVFILRAKDIRAVGVLGHYLKYCVNNNHRAAVRERIADFKRFAATQYHRMKEPDTARSSQPTG